MVTPIVTARRILGSLLLLLAGSALLPETVSGQEPERVRPRTSLADSFAYRTATFEPSSGPPGTKVAVRWEFLPAITPMRLGVGAQRVGFEVLTEVLSDEKGQFADTIRIPEWADTSRPVMLVVFDFYFNPLAISSAFQVTDANGMVSRTGRLQEQTGRCAELLTTDGDRYYLKGDASAYAPGDRVVVSARLAKPSDCGRGERDVALEVVGIRRAIGG